MRPSLPSALTGLAFAALVLSASACTKTIDIGRDTDMHDAAQLNPFGNFVEYDVDAAIVLDAPRRICIGAVTMPAAGPKTDGKPPDQAGLADLIRRSLVAHAHMRFDDLDIAVTPGKPDEDAVDAALSGCTYLLTADLVRDDEFYTLFWSRRRLGIELRLAALDTDQTLWTARHVDARNEASMPLDPVSFVIGVFRTQDFAADKDIVPSMVDDVMRRLFATFPDLPGADLPAADK